MLQFTAGRAAVAGAPILPFFDYQRGLVDSVTWRSRYVPDWVRVFYSIVYVDADRGCYQVHVHGLAAETH
jgi:hypothetical protein